MKRAILMVAIALLTSSASVDLANAQNRRSQGGQGGAGGQAGQSGSEGSGIGRRGGGGFGQAGQDGQAGEGFRGGAGGQGGGQVPGPSPIVAAIDENADGEISSSEIESAVESLKSLDKDGDGKLSESEIRPRGPGRRSDTPEEPRPEGGGAGAGGRSPDEFLARLMQADQNSDGKISKDEAPERLQAMFERIDGDSDGFLGKDELQQIAQRRRDGGQGGPPNARGPGGQPGLGGGVGPGGPGNAEAFVDRMFQFDANGDGNLTREELAKGAEQFGAGRRSGDRPEGGEGEGRPRRPQRPNDNQNN